jgi:hypothetical protein
VFRVEINRNQYFLAGLVVLALGLQLRAVETYVLNESSASGSRPWPARTRG